MNVRDAKVGARVRVLVEVENTNGPGGITPPGAVGRIVYTFPADDFEYYVELDEMPGSRVCFTEHELDQLELLEGVPRETN